MPSVETTAILISDLVGSTRLETEIGPERADQLRREHFDVLRRAIADSGGEEVKNTGDGLMVAFRSASGAVACAIAMQQLIDRRNRGADAELHIRVGIGMGEATVEDGDYFGIPSIEAARLCAKASDDGILAGEVVRMMAGRGDRDAFKSVGELELKGLPEPVEAFEVSWEPVGAELSSVALPGPLRSVPALAYVGRVGERERLASLWANAQEGSRRAVLISGEPGIGKTRLAAHTALSTHADGATVMWGAASQDLGAAYAPWIEALGRYVEQAPEQVLTDHVARHGGEIARLARGLGQRIRGVTEPQESDAETERYLLFAAVAGLLEAACSHGPVTLVLDDFQWADKQSLTLLRHVARAIESSPLLLLVTYRDSDLDREHPMTEILADLRRVEGVERVSLDGLGPDEVAEVMSAAAGHDIGELGMKLAVEIAQETGGNPFFVGEILQHLTESGALTTDEDGRWRLTASIAELGLPQSVRDVVSRRVERLGEDLRQILTAASVIGRSFDLELLARVLDRNEDEILDALDTALEASVVLESPDGVGRFSFSHALINHTLYGQLSATRRARTHRQVAEALERLCGDDPGERLPELANHWGHAVVTADQQKAVRYARQAGEQALAELAPDDALRWFNQALELVGDDEQVRCDLLTGIGTAQKHLGDPAFRATLLDAAAVARRIDDVQRLVHATLENTRGWHSAAGEIDVERVDGLEASIAAVDESSPDRPMLLALLAAELTFSGDYERVSALADEAIASARELEDRRPLGRVLYWACNAQLGSAATAQTFWMLSAELEELADELADPLLQWGASQWRFTAALRLGETDEMNRSLARAHEISAEVGQPAFLWVTTYYDCSRQQFFGNLEQAEASALQAAGVGHESGQSDTLMIAGVQLFAIRHEQARLEELIELVEQRVDENPGLPTLQATLAFAYSELGRLEESKAILDQAATDDFASLPFDVGWINGLARYAEVAARLDATAPAAVIYEKLLPFRDQIVTSVFTVSGSVERVLGVLAATLGRWEDADEHFAKAAELHERLGAKLFLARTWMNWARALLARGEASDAEHAAELLERATELARGLGGGAVVREAEALRAKPLGV
ncbi:MAG: AAA family ATPase [Solirubrobacterales bacterium]|nr:AAA family ATPase [Solirubrobacterales bacterium]